MIRNEFLDIGKKNTPVKVDYTNALKVKMSPKILSFFTYFSHSIRLNSLMTQIQAVSTEEFVR